VGGPFELRAGDARGDEDRHLGEPAAQPGLEEQVAAERELQLGEPRAAQRRVERAADAAGVAEDRLGDPALVLVEVVGLELREAVVHAWQLTSR
jgi:hypothetical protein